MDTYIINIYYFGNTNYEVFLLKIKDNIDLCELCKFNYRYESNLIFPTYKKVCKSGSSKIVIEILVFNRRIFINRSKDIKKKQLKFIGDLILAKFVEK